TEAERDLASDLGYRAPTAVIPNGIDWSAFAAERTTEAAASRPKIVLYLGRLSHKKGLDVLLQAFAKMAMPDTRLVIAGPDDEHLTPSLETLARRLGIDGRVEFTGLLDGEERLAALHNADLWVLPSKTENFGTAVIEAMA